MKKGMSVLLLVFCVMILSASGAGAASQSQVQTAVDNTAAYLLKNVADPQVGSIGGEWAILGLARSGYDVPDTYWQIYLQNLEKTVSDAKGVLHDKKYTEYSRVTLALTALGQDPTAVAGYNLLAKLGDFDKTVWQGINGPIFALLALDSGGYAIPTCAEAATQATRDLYIQKILSLQLSDGGFALSGSVSDPDITGMALQALAKYQDRAEVKQAIDRALVRLSQMQDEDGGYDSWGATNAESVVQVLVALVELGLDPDDARFVKNGKSLADNILSYAQKDGSFSHDQEGTGSNGMATEQCFYGLVSWLRAKNGQNSLYNMSDVRKAVAAGATSTPTGNGLSGKNAAVQAVPVTQTGKTFSDIANHAAKTAIEALASRGIITGVDEDTFAPDRTMTRAEFAAIVVRGLGITPQTGSAFTDVPAGSWYASFVGAANTYGLVNGVTAATFAPNETISREEGAVMISRAAQLCGLDTEMSAAATRDMLAQFGDYTSSSDWARPALAFCYQKNILSQDDLEIRPHDPVKRSEVSSMLYQLLRQGQLL